LAELAGLQFEGTVTARSQGQAVRVTGEGDRLIVTFNRGAWRSLRRYARRSSTGSPDGVGFLIDRAAATIELRVGNRTIATAEPGEPANWIGRLLGVEPFRPRPWPLLASMLG